MIWVDAVCINQSGYQGKSDQVRLMQKIYEKAENIHIWLGRPLSLEEAELGAAKMKYLR
jgi:Heterokaryon incompatibility protein (HET)